MEFGKRHDTTDFCPHQLVIGLTDLLWICYREAIAYAETCVMDFGLPETVARAWQRALSNIIKYV